MRQNDIIASLTLSCAAHFAGPHSLCNVTSMVQDGLAFHASCNVTGVQLHITSQGAKVQTHDIGVHVTSVQPLPFSGLFCSLAPEGLKQAFLSFQSLFPF